MSGGSSRVRTSRASRTRLSPFFPLRTPATQETFAAVIRLGTQVLKREALLDHPNKWLRMRPGRTNFIRKLPYTVSENVSCPLDLALRLHYSIYKPELNPKN